MAEFSSVALQLSYKKAQSVCLAPLLLTTHVKTHLFCLLSRKRALTKCRRLNVFLGLQLTIEGLKKEGLINNGQSKTPLKAFALLCVISGWYWPETNGERACRMCGSSHCSGHFSGCYCAEFSGEKVTKHSTRAEILFSMG